MTKKKPSKLSRKPTAKDDGRKIEVVWVDPTVLVPYTRNAKLHTPEQVERIRLQIRAYGFDQPIVVLKDMTIVKGHGRREAAILEGLKLVPVIVKDMTKEAAAAARIGDNKSAESPWINEFLRLELIDLQELGFDIPAMTGFDSPEFRAIIEGWSPAPEGKADPEGDDPGLMARVTVTCRQQDRERVVTAIEQALKSSGVKDALVS